MQLGQILRYIAILSDWYDQSTSDEYKDDALASHWAQVGHMAEEVGEVAAELIKWTGQNPRKSRTESIQPLLREAADVVLTGMLTIQHFTKNEAETGNVLVERLRVYNGRMVAGEWRLPPLFDAQELWMWRDIDQYSEWLDGMFANVPECWDGDAAAESILEDYLHHLEESGSQHTRWCDESNPLGHD